MTEERTAAPLWLQLVLAFTLPLWLPAVPVAAWWRGRSPRRRPARVDTLPLLEFFDAEWIGA